MMCNVIDIWKGWGIVTFDLKRSGNVNKEKTPLTVVLIHSSKR